MVQLVILPFTDLDHYRAAYVISQRAADGMASTEDLRQAMIHYRALFEDLLGAGSEPGSEPGAGRAADARPTVDAGASETDLPSRRRS